MKSNKSTSCYDEKEQPLKEKISLSLILSCFFSFGLFFFGPYDFYLSNIGELLIPESLIFKAIIPTAVISFVILFFVCFLTKGKAHIAVCSVVFGTGTALYVQGNILSLGLGKLDGTEYSVSAFRSVRDLAIWAFLIAVPFLVFKYNKPIYKNFIAILPALLLFVQIITISYSNLRITLLDEGGNLYTNLHSGDDIKDLSLNNEFVYSKNKNFIIILPDEYDSFCFDAAAQTDPETTDSFDGFTYYKDTVGMYGMTDTAVPHIFTGEITGGSEITDDSFFGSIKKNYQMNIYAGRKMFSEKICSDYADNYTVKNIDNETVKKTSGIFFKVTMFRYLPEVLKKYFYVYDDFNRIFSDIQSYYPDDLTFYNSLPGKLELTEEPQFKFIYLTGLHDPRNITADLQRASNWSVSGDEQAVAMNKILAKYFTMLKNNGVYDNSEIIVLADHGLKSNENGAFPLLMIKRAGDTRKGLTVSNAQISYSEVYPTLMYMAGEDTGAETVFDIGENDQRKRYFAQNNSYFNEKLK